MASEADHEGLMQSVHSLAYFYQGTSISEFRNMPVDEVEEAVENMKRIAKERERAHKRGV